MAGMDPTRDLVAANNQFGLDLFARLVDKQPDENVFIAPHSLAAVLAMTYNGAAGTTREAMAGVLHLMGMELPAINRVHAWLQGQLQDLDPQIQLAIANSLWAKAGITFKADFMQRNRDFYGAEIAVMHPNKVVAMETINAWVNEETGGKIDRLVTDISPLTVLFLINATYFKGNWGKPFDPAHTRSGDFNLLDGSTKELPMMSQSGEFRHWRGVDFQAVSLPYGQGRVNAYVFLPDRGVALQALRERLVAEDWPAMRYRFQSTEGRLVLPRFKVECDVVLNDILIALGMGVAFDDLNADFSDMCPIPPLPTVYIFKVQHKTFLEVNEEGTEAAAASLVEMRIRGFQPKPEPFQMIVDRPFLLAITDDRTGTILFLGSIVNPS